jgi:hypothetical protein
MLLVHDTYFHGKKEDNQSQSSTDCQKESHTDRVIWSEDGDTIANIHGINGLTVYSGGHRGQNQHEPCQQQQQQQSECPYKPVDLTRPHQLGMSSW